MFFESLLHICTWFKANSSNTMAQSGPQDSLDPWRKLRPLRGASLPVSRPQLQVGRPCRKAQKGFSSGHHTPSPIQRASTSTRVSQVPRTRRCLGPGGGIEIEFVIAAGHQPIPSTLVKPVPPNIQSQLTQRTEKRT